MCCADLLAVSIAIYQRPYRRFTGDSKRFKRLERKLSFMSALNKSFYDLKLSQYNIESDLKT